MTSADDVAAPAALARIRRAAGDALGTPGFGGLLACALALGLTASFVVPFLSLWGTTYIGMTPLVFATFMTLNSVSAMGASTVLARWSDTRWSRRTVLLLGGASGMLGYLGYAFVREPLLLMLIGATLMSVSSVNFSQIFAFARERLTRSEGATDAPFTLGVLRAFFSLAWTVGPAIGALVVQHFGYRGSFLSAAGLLAVFVCLVFAFVSGGAPAPAAAAKTTESIGRLLTRPNVLVNFCAFVLIFMALSMNMMNLPLFITRELGGTERQVGTAFAIAPIIEIPLMIGFGRISSRARQSMLIRAGVLLGVLYFLAISYAPAPWHIYPAQVCVAFTIAVTMSLAIPYFQDLLPGQTGLATSVYSNSWNLGSLLGFAGFGLLVEPLGHRGLIRLCSALAAVSFAVLISSRRGARAGSMPPVVGGTQS